MVSINLCLALVYEVRLAVYRNYCAIRDGDGNRYFGRKTLQAFRWDYLLQMLRKNALGDAEWWKSFLSCFLNKGLANAAASRSKAGVDGLNEELTRFYNLLWLTREQLRIFGHEAPFTLCNHLVDTIYLKIPYYSQRDLQDLSLNNVSLPGYNFQGDILLRAYLEKAILSYSDFSDADIYAANLRFAQLEQIFPNDRFLFRTVQYGKITPN